MIYHDDVVMGHVLSRLIMIVHVLLDDVKNIRMSNQNCLIDRFRLVFVREEKQKNGCVKIASSLNNDFDIDNNG